MECAEVITKKKWKVNAGNTAQEKAPDKCACAYVRAVHFTVFERPNCRQLKVQFSYILLLLLLLLLLLQLGFHPVAVVLH
jgi:hypothetical protein